MTIDFQPYLTSIYADREYNELQDLYTPTDALSRQLQPAKKSRFRLDLQLQVQTVPPPQREGQTPDREQIERFNVLEGLRKYAANHVLLVGRPGSGKSTALQRLLWEEAQTPLDKLEKIPVLIELRQYKTSTLDLIHNFLKRHKLNIEKTAIEKLLDENRLLLLFDGVNELPNETARQDLNTFRQNYPQISMIFTTRDLGVGGDLGIEKKLEMQPLTETQMQQFVRAYLPDTGEEMLRRLGEKLQNFAQTPLLLLMLCTVFEQTGDIPANLGLVFRSFAQSYNKKFWDSVQVSDEFRRWIPELLQHLAFTMMQDEPPTEFRLAINEQEAKEILTKFLEGKVDYPPNKARAWLEELLKHHLIQFANNNQIEFRHQLLQEYYAAEYLLPQIKNISDAKLTKDYINYLEWTQTLALMLALLDNEVQAVRIVKLALDVDLMLGARLAGEVKIKYQHKTIDLIINIQTTQKIRIILLGYTRSNKAISTLVSALIDNNDNVAWYAAESLSKIATEEVISALIPLLNNENFDIFQNTAYALSKIRSENSVLGLLPCLQNDNPSIRCKAINALGEIGHNLATSSILQALSDKDSSVRREAAEALGKIDLDSIDLDLVVTALIKSLGDEGFWVRESAVFALGKICSDKDLLELLEVFKNKTIDLFQQYMVISSENQNDDLLSWNLKHLERKYYGFRNAIASVVNTRDSNLIIPTLLDHLNNGNPWVRANAVYILGETKNKKILPELLKTLTEESIFALGNIGDESVLSELLNLLQDENWRICSQAATALGKIRSEKAVPELIKKLNDENSLVRANCVYALGEIGTESAMAGVKSALSDKESNVRRSAVFALGENNNYDSVINLRTALQDEDTWVRAYAAEVLGKIGTDIAVEILLPVLKDKEPSVRRGAIRGLEQANTTIADKELLEALQDEDKMVCHDAAYALGKIASHQVITRVIEILHKTEEAYLFDTITNIQRRCKFYNYNIFNSPALAEDNKTDPLLDTLNKLNQTMSENQPTSKYSFPKAETVQIIETNHGEVIAHKYAPEQKQNLAEAAKEIQQLLAQLAQQNPTIVQSQNNDIVLETIHQEIKRNPTIKARLLNALKSGGTEALKVALDAIFKNPIVSVSVETIKGFIEAE